MEIYRELDFEGIEFNPQTILYRYIGIEEKNRMTLLTIFNDHNERCRKLAGKDMSPSTVTCYETSYRHTEEFIRFNYQKDDE